MPSAEQANAQIAHYNAKWFKDLIREGRFIKFAVIPTNRTEKEKRDYIEKFATSSLSALDFANQSAYNDFDAGFLFDSTIKKSLDFDWIKEYLSKKEKKFIDGLEEIAYFKSGKREVAECYKLSTDGDKHHLQYITDLPEDVRKQMQYVYSEVYH